MGTQAGWSPYEGSRRSLDVTPRRSPWAQVTGMWLRHQDILKNAISLLATTGLTSGLGFAYWNVAARLFNQSDVGYAAAAVSVVSLLSWLGIFGLGTLLIGELPRRAKASGLIWAAVLASGLGSLLLAVGFVLVVPHFTKSFDDLTGSVTRAAFLCAAVALTAMTVVFDSATIGLLRGGLQLTRNLTFVTVKMLTLVAASVLLHTATGLGIFVSWVLAIPVSLVPVVIRLWFTRELALPRPDWHVLRSLSKTVFAHNWLNLAIQAPPLLTPVLVASMLKSSDNAAFYAAWTISSVLYIVPTHLSTVLFAVASGDPEALAPKLRFTLRTSVIVGIPGMAVLGFGAHSILSIFGPGYAKVAAAPMQLIVLGYLPALPKFYYIAVCRAVGKISRAAGVLTTFSVIEVAAVVVGCLRDGLMGLAVAMLIVGVIEAIVTLPAVAAAALRRGRHRRQGAETAALSSQVRTKREFELASAATTRMSEAERRYQSRQRESLAVLMSLGVPTLAPVLPMVSDGPAPHPD
jgi:O-antigen/teichoic acid export membrane protein